MEMIIICLVAFAASLLTFFSGFGLGTLLMPIMAIFFPIELAIALTGIVHLLNNLFKLGLIGKHAVLRVILLFGISGMLGALGGAYLLGTFLNWEPVSSFTLFGRMFIIMPINLIIGILLVLFAFLEFWPNAFSFSPKKSTLIMGGTVSGFFGGLSGHQGALRSAFLIKLGLNKEQFIASGVVIACLIDVSRLYIYSDKFLMNEIQENYPLLIAATLSAFIGAWYGNKFLKKITLKTVQLIIGILLIILAVGLILGII